MHTTEPNQYALSFPTVVAFMIGMKKVSGNYAQSRRTCYQDEKGRRVGIYVLLNCLPTPPPPLPPSPESTTLPLADLVIQALTLPRMP